MEGFNHRDRPERDENFDDVRDRGRIVSIASDDQGLDSPYEYETDSRGIVRDRSP